MLLAQEKLDDAYCISGYGADGIHVNQQLYRHSIIITGHHIASWLVTAVNQITALDATLPLLQTAEIILLGTGPTLIFPTPSQLQLFTAPKRGIEVMTTAAACRTFHVLRSEHRRVAALLIVAKPS